MLTFSHPSNFGPISHPIKVEPANALNITLNTTRTEISFRDLEDNTTQAAKVVVSHVNLERILQLLTQNATIV